MSRIKKALFAFLASSIFAGLALPGFVSGAVINKNLPNDPFFSNQWSLDNTGQRVRGVKGLEDIDMDLPEAWEYIEKNFSSREQVIVAVLDSGVNYDHLDLKDSILRNGGGEVVGHDFIDNDDDPKDNNGHGTIIAGIIAAQKNNRRGIAGINDMVKIMPVKVLDDAGSGNTAILGEAIIYAVDNGADVINLSLAGNYDEGLSEAVSYAYNNGVIIVSASGGEGTNINDGSLKSPLNNEGQGENQVIGVSCLTNGGGRYEKSNYGKGVDVSAPGTSVISTYSRTDRSYVYASGTSLAAANVSGIVSLLKSCYPNLSNAKIIEAVINSAAPFTETMEGMGSGTVNGLEALKYLSDSEEDPEIPENPAERLIRFKDEPTVYFVKDGIRRGIPRPEVLKARGFTFDDVEVVESKSELEQYVLGKVLGFPAGWVIKGSAPTVFEIQENEIARPFTNPAPFLSRGHKWEDIMEISDSELLQCYTIGEIIAE